METQEEEKICRVGAVSPEVNNRSVGDAPKDTQNELDHGLEHVGGFAEKKQGDKKVIP